MSPPSMMEESLAPEFRSQALKRRTWGQWWSRPCGAGEVLHVALPLVISMLSWSLMHFVDRMMLFWWSTDAVAAALPAGALHWTMISFPWGVALYVNTFVAQYYGAGRPERVGAVLGQGIRLALYVTPLFLLAALASPYFFRAAGHEPRLIGLESLYFQTLAIGGAGTVMSASLASFFTGRGQTRVVMMVDVAAAVLNIALDYAWIFGHWGFPAMGIEGAGWATSVAQCFKAAAFWLLMHRRPYLNDYQLIPGRRWDMGLLRRMLKFGGPNGWQHVIETGVFTVFIMFMGQFGAVAMAATTLAFNINALAFIPMMGIGMAVMTLVGQQLGKNSPHLAARATWTALTMGLIYSTAFAALYVLFPDLCLLGHAFGASSEEFARVRPLAIILLRFVGLYCLLDAVQVILSSAIKGAGDTQFVLTTTLFVSLTAVLIGWLGSRYWGGELLWWWTVVTVWIWVVAVIYWGRFVQGKWRAMRVIESEVIAEEN